jgi:hypothetical protein
LCGAASSWAKTGLASAAVTIATALRVLIMIRAFHLYVVSPPKDVSECLLTS